MKSRFVFPRHTKADMPVAVAGDGPYLIDAEGKRYLDASGGAAVSCLGHSDLDIRAAIQDQLDTLAFAHSGFFTCEPAEALAEKLVSLAPDGIERTYFVSGGSEAMEAAIKLARQYFLEIDQPERRNIIARWQSYHGNTIGALSAGGNRWRRSQFAPFMVEAMHHVSPCRAYRDKLPNESDTAYADRLAAELEDKIVELGPDTVAAFLAEPVVGATMGAVPPVEGYFQKIKAVCDKYDILLVADEVMCGMGRTGTLFACEQDGIAPDMIAIAKGLGAGYQPIGALMVSGRIYDAVAAGSGFFQHGHTYNGHAMATAAGLAVLEKISHPHMLAGVREKGRYLTDRLAKQFSDHAHIGDIRGRGLFIGLELVADRETKTPFPPGTRLAARIKANAMALGLMCYPMSGTIDGESGDHILLAPPFIVENTEIDLIVDRLAAAIENSLI
ncbi:aspartate aminotransferase family protein [Pelagibacterium flavum]|uniref:Aspartate aminotransferase family protein n=1 Tax=Pelagibacterium flavum TaxID=2984530 RepID=A0ABY6IVC8_9HYPH|nr:aspartate aminotransferase family protein [Pelagibacterium sp. YIM 151497]UYQ73140.1 aspartate aminotransferase family protein [Pelagibacterium sp. YIM 151497]